MSILIRDTQGGKRLQVDAIFYHTKDVNPVWNRNMTLVKNDGAHIFYSFRRRLL